MKKAALVLDDERLLRAAATKSLREFVLQAFNIVVPAEPSRPTGTQMPSATTWRRCVVGRFATY
jgi:hypothetical protein